MLEHAIRAREHGIGIAVRFAEIALHVGMRHGRPFARDDERIALGVRVDERRIRGDRLFGIEDRRQLVVLHVDRLRGGLRRFARFGCNRDDVLTDEAHDIAGEHGPVEERAAEVVLADVGAGEHRVHAGHLARRFHIDRDDPRVRHGARYERGPQHAGPRSVGRVRCRPADLGAAFDAQLIGGEGRSSRRDHRHSSGSLTIGVVWNS